LVARAYLAATLSGEHRRALVPLGEAETRARSLDDGARLGPVLSLMSFLQVQGLALHNPTAEGTD